MSEIKSHGNRNNDVLTSARRGQPLREMKVFNA